DLNIPELAERTRQWLGTLPQFAGSALALTGFAHVGGSGSTGETLTAQLQQGGQPPRSIVIRLQPEAIRTYLDARLQRQQRVIEWVASNTAVPVPTVLAVDDEGGWLGRRAMVMERIEGAAAPDYPGYNIAGFLCDMSPEG